MATRTLNPRANSSSFSAELLFVLEEDLSKPTFFDVPLGSTLGDHFSVLFKGNHDFRLRTVARDTLLCIKYMFRAIPSCSSISDLPSNRILVTWLADKKSLRDMVLPLIQELGADRCLVVGENAGMREKISDSTAFVTWDSLPACDMKIWRKEMFRVFPTLVKSLIVSCLKYDISLSLVPSIVRSLLIQSQKIVAYGKLLDVTIPLGVVTEYDRHHNASCLILLAKQRNIETISLVHGVVNPPYGYTPVLADHLFCWGAAQRKVLIQLGVNPKILEITGIMHISNSIISNGNRVSEKLGLDGELPTILLATSPVNSEDRIRLVDVFCTAAISHKVQRLVRLHPSEKLEFYSSEIKKYPNTRFIHSDETTLDESLSIASFVCCHDSTVGLEALIKGVPVIVLDVLSVGLSGGLEYVMGAECPRVRTSEDLAKLVQAGLHDSVAYDARRHKQSNYIEKNYPRIAGDAVELTALRTNSILTKGV